MSVNLIGDPPAISYNGDDNYFFYASNLIDADPVAKITLDLSGTGPVVAEEITLEWAGISVLLTVATTLNAAATAWPVKSGAETLAEYADRVAEGLRQNGIITEAWHVNRQGAAGAAERIQLEYRDLVILDVTVTNGLTNVAESVDDGTDPQTESNLSCLVQVWKVEATAQDDTLLGSLQSPYDLLYGTTEFNLKDYFDLKPTLPTTSSIKPGIITTWPNGIAFNTYLEYYLRANDKYGIPAVPLALVRTEDNYVMIHGSRSLDHDNSTSLGSITALHRYRRRDGGIFRKPLTEFMPDYFYLWALSDLTDCNVEFVITWSDGTDTSHPSTLSDFDLAADKIHWVRSTPLSLAYTPPSTGAFPEYVLFKLLGDAGSGEVTLAEVKYTVKPTADWHKYILFDNGLGGCETALFYGKTTKKMEAKREISRRPRIGEWSIADGELFNVGAEGQRGFDMNTGWIPKYYSEHLQQLLLGAVWMIDYDQKKFIRLLCDSSSVEVNKDDETLHSLQVSFKLGFYDTAFNI